MAVFGYNGHDNNPFRKAVCEKCKSFITPMAAFKGADVIRVSCPLCGHSVQPGCRAGIYSPPDKPVKPDKPKMKRSNPWW